MAMELAPEDQDKLAQLFGGKLGGNPGMPGIGGLPPGSAPVSAGAPMPLPGMPGGTVAPRPPAASDDPAVAPPQGTSPMPGASPLPPAPTFLPPALAQQNALSAKIAQAQTPLNRADYQPHWWEKALTVPAAILGGLHGIPSGEAAAKAVWNRRFNNAQEEQNRKVAPMQAEFERNNKINPMVTETNENTQRSFSDNLARVKQLQDTTNKEDALDQRQKQLQEKASNDKTTADTRQQREDEREKNDKTISDLKDRYQKLQGEVQDRNATTRERAVDDKEKKVTAAKGTAAIENEKDTAIAKAHAQYAKDTSDLPKDPAHKWTAEELAQSKDAHDAYNQAVQDAEDAYEAKVNDAGGTAPHRDVTTDPDYAGKNTPAASSPSTPAAGSAQTGAKAVTKDVVQKYATTHKMDYNTALTGFQQKGYKVQ